MHEKTKKAFTLVELVIVIAIIAILAVSAFLVLTKWITKSRDSKRIADMGIIESALQVRVIDKKYFTEPIVQRRKFIYKDITDVRTISYQGKFDEQLKKKLGIGGDIRDPSDTHYYTYSVDITKTLYSIMAMMESKTYNLSYLSEVKAGDRDYTNRYPRLQGHKIGIFIRDSDKIPAEDITEDTEQDISTKPELVGYMTSNDKISTENFVLLRGGGDASNNLIGFYPFCGDDPLLDRSLGVQNNLSSSEGQSVGKIGTGRHKLLTGNNYIATNLPFTVMLWAKNIDGTVFLLGSGNNVFSILGNATDITYYASGATDKAVLTKTQRSSDWVHLAISLNTDTDNVYFYLNGILVGSNSFKDDISLPADTILKIGGDSYIDEVRVYSRSLSSQNIKNIYESEK